MHLSPSQLGCKSTSQIVPDHTAFHHQTKGYSCDRARIPFGLMVEGGVIWHDLRRTFATELRGRQVHEYDIADLLGHTIQSVTGTYARSTPEALEDAVNRLTEPRATVVQFKRKAS